MTTTIVHDLTHERDALALDLLQADAVYDYRTAQQLADECLIACVAYAVAWDAAVALQRDQAAEPKPSPPPTSAQRARDKAAYYLATGLRIMHDGADYLVPSGTRGGVIHRIHSGVCSCEAGQHNHVCWHLMAVQLLEEPFGTAQGPPRRAA